MIAEVKRAQQCLPAVGLRPYKSLKLGSFRNERSQSLLKSKG